MKLDIAAKDDIIAQNGPSTEPEDADPRSVPDVFDSPLSGSDVRPLLDGGRRRWLVIVVLSMFAILAGIVVADVVARRGPATLVMDDFAFRPEVLRLDADVDGQVLMLSNVSSDNPHDFTVVGLPDDVLVHLALFEETLDLPYYLPAMPAGTYTIYCSVPGHRALGMEAVMEVS